VLRFLVPGTFFFPQEQLAGGFSPELFGKGEICGDIIGPFHEEWADSDALKVSD
jgi:hypothetical protein